MNADNWHTMQLMIDAMHKFDDYFMVRQKSIYLFGDTNVDTRPDVFRARLAYDRAMELLETSHQQDKYDALER